MEGSDIASLCQFIRMQKCNIYECTYLLFPQQPNDEISVIEREDFASFGWDETG